MEDSKSSDTWIEELYAYAERNIIGYVRPNDYKERVARVLSGSRKPMRTARGHPGDNYDV